MKPKQKRLRPPLKWLTRLFLSFLVFFILLFLFAYIFIRIQYPPEKIKTILTTELKTALNNRPVSIDRVSLKLIKGFVVENISVFSQSNINKETAENKPEISIKKVYMKYKISSLFRRTLRIKDISIEQPFICVSVDEHGKTNFDDILLPMDTTNVQPKDTAQTALNFPLNINLDNFKFEGLSACFKSESIGETYELNIRGFSIYANDLFVPRGDLLNIKKGLRGKLRVVSDSAPWDLKIQSSQLKSPLHLMTKFDSNINLSANGFEKLKLNGNLRFKDVLKREIAASIEDMKTPVNDLIDIFLSMNMDAEEGRIQANRIDVFFAEEEILSLNGELINLLSNPELSIIAQKTSIDLSKISTAILPLIPSDWEKHVHQARVDGDIVIEDLNFRGYPIENNWQFDFRLDLKNVNAFYPQAGLTLSNLFITSHARGKFNSNEVMDGKLMSDVSLSSVIIAPDDSTLINIGELTTSLNAELPQGVFPSSMKLKGLVADVFGSEVTLDFQYDDSKIDSELIAEAELNLSQLDLTMIPGSQGTGNVDARLILRAKSFEDIALNLNVQTDTIKFLQNNEELALSPLTISGDFNVATDTTLDHIRAKNIQIEVNDFLSVKGSAIIDGFLEENFQVNIDTAVLRHDKSFDFLPSNFKKEIGKMKVGGSTILTAQIDGRIPASQDIVFSSEANIHIRGNMDYPEIPLTAGSINGQIALNLNEHRAKGNAAVELHNFIMPEIRDKALNETFLNFNFDMPDYNQILIERAVLNSPEICSEVILQAQINNLDTTPVIEAEGTIEFTSADTVLLINDMYVQGEMKSDIHLKMFMQDVKVRGKLELDSVNIRYMDEVFLKNITGEIPVVQRFNVESGTLVNEKSGLSYLTDIKALNYNVLNTYFFDEGSCLKIEEIEAYDYKLQNFIVNIYLGNGKLEIPRFSLNLYDGNMSGNFTANLGDGRLENARYSVKANVSRLNSAKMATLLTGSLSSSELNMNMEIEGTGLDPELEMDFSGFLYITKIGSKFTENVLTSLDPKRTDKSIQDTKRLLKWGYKPKLISFEIKHGYMYPSIHLVKGNILTKLIPLNLSGGKIELARIPVKFFIEM